MYRALRALAQEVAMAAPSSAGPPRLRMMCSLELDEHPTHHVRDHLLALSVLVLFCAITILLSR